MYFETIKQTLFPRFENISRWKLETEIEKFKLGFDSHCQIMANYIQKNENKLDNLDIDFFVWFHKLLYPAWFQIKAVWNDWVAHIMFPWEFRKQFFLKHITDFSSIENIEIDFEKLLVDFNKIEVKNRLDIMKLYFDFWSVHPFWDSNWTIISIVCDLLCKKFWFSELNLLNLSFKDKNTLFKIIEIYEKENNLEKVLNIVDEFNNKT